MGMSCDNGSGINNDIKAYVTNYDTLNSADDIIIGTINIHPVLAGTRNDEANYINAVDDDDSTTIQINSTNELAVKIKGSGATPGILSRAANSIELKAYITNATAGIHQIAINYFNNEYNSGVGSTGSGQVFTYTSGTELKTYDLSYDFTGRDVSDEPWRWEELLGLEYYIRAQTSFNITVRDFWLRITNIIVNDPRVIPIRKVRTRRGRATTSNRDSRY